jgi:hypothetical protein
MKTILGGQDTLEPSTPMNHIDRDAFYRELTLSASGFTNPALQTQIRSASIAIIGLGGVGSPVARELARAGFERITILDPDSVEIGNISKQNYTFDQVGQNKALATADNLRRTNPFVQLKVFPDGLTISNLREVVAGSRIIFDAIDIERLDLIWELHKEAALQRKPVIIGYDLAGTAMLVTEKYDKEVRKPLGGTLNEDQVSQFNQVRKAYLDERISKKLFLDFVYDLFTGPVNPLHVPIEQFQEILSRHPEETKSYQLGTTSSVLGSLTVEVIKRMLENKDIRRTVHVDMPSLIREKNPSFFHKAGLMIRTFFKLRSKGRQVRRDLGLQ